MKGFKIVNGDISITDNQIDMVEGTELEVQTMKTVLQTNEGEDVFDENEGVDFRQILGKNITADMVKTQIQKGVNQVNSDYMVEDFNYSIDKMNRKSQISFIARKQNGTAVTINSGYN